MEEEVEDEERKTEEEKEPEDSGEAAEGAEVQGEISEVEEKVEEKAEGAAEGEPEAAPEEVAAPAEEEGAKPAAREKKEEEIVEERFYTIPLSRAWIMPANRRAPRAVRLIRSFVVRHMKFDVRKEGEEEEEPQKLVISNEVNERVWSRGIEKPPRKIRVRAAKDKDGNVTVYLAEGD